MRLKKIIFISIILLAVPVLLFAQSDKTINIMTYNIHRAVGVDGNFDIDRIAQLMKDNNIDIAALQEVDIETERIEGINLLDSLASLTGMNWRFGKTIELQGGGYGNGFLTKLPILNYENIKFKMLTDNEPRAFMKLRLKIGTDTLVFVNTHFDHNKNDKERINLAKQLMENLENVNQPVIICGDLNDTPKSETLDILTSGFSDVWSLIKREEKATFPAGDPERRIDYILTSIKETAHGQLKPLSIKILESLASDHLPVIMEIRINQ